MDVETLRVIGKDAIDRVCEYASTVNSVNVFPDVEPGYLIHTLPDCAPEKPEKWETIMKNFEKNILKGITHWQHNQFFAYVPSGSGFASLIGDMITDALAVVPITWMASPAGVELQIIIMNWLCKSMGLPEEFTSTSTGGGVIQSTTSECISNCMIAARSYALKKLKYDNPNLSDIELLPRLIAYCSEESEMYVKKVADLLFVQLRILPTDETCSLQGETVKNAVINDISNGFVPIFLCVNFGTISSTAIDNLAQIGPLCEKYKIWCHVDAAYGGCSLLCEEMRPLCKGLEFADSFNTDADKWCLAHDGVSCLWVKDRKKYCSAFMTASPYPKPEDVNLLYNRQYWGLTPADSFKSLKLWFLIQYRGIAGIREYQRNHIKMAQLFEELLIKDGRFEIMNQVKFGLVCFRLKNTPDEINQELLSQLNESRLIHMTPTQLKGKFSIRFCITSPTPKKADILVAFEQIQTYATKLIKETRDGRCTCDLPRQFAFIKKIPKNIYDEIPKPMLKGNGTPILVPALEDDDLEQIYEF